MRIVKIFVILVLAFVAGGSAFAQSVGELDRFDNEQLEKRNEVKLFPNPTVDYLSVQIENTDLTDVQFTVHNIIGNIVEVEVEKINDGNFKVKVEGLATGYYLLAIKDKGKHFAETYKFLKR